MITYRFLLASGTPGSSKSRDCTLDSVMQTKSQHPFFGCWLFWRRVRDSNPGFGKGHGISSLLVSVSTSGRFVSILGRLV